MKLYGYVWGFPKSLCRSTRVALPSMTDKGIGRENVPVMGATTNRLQKTNKINRGKTAPTQSYGKAPEKTGASQTLPEPSLFRKGHFIPGNTETPAGENAGKGPGGIFPVSPGGCWLPKSRRR